MARTTKRGLELARKLQPMFGHRAESGTIGWQAVAEVLSLIARHARTHHRLAEAACNRELTATEQRREVQLEGRILGLCKQLPLVGGEEIRPLFSGDPRGATVKLALPGEWHRLHDCFGGEGVCV